MKRCLTDIVNREAEKNFARLKAENPDIVAAARRGSSVVDPEAGIKPVETYKTDQGVSKIE